MSHGGVLRIDVRNREVASDEIATLTPGKYLKFTFTDTGPGISAEHLTRIFDPYFTTKRHGNGLGLATVYSIVKRHHGHLDVQSELGHGTTFHVWFPAAEAPAVETPAAPPALLKRSGRVLVMDDEPGIRQLITSLLQRIGFKVTAVADGAAVVQEYRRAQRAGEAISCVILDLTVPAGMGGAEAMAQLREIDPNVCAIVSSGYSKDPVVANFRAHGFRGIMPKPYNVDDVVRVISAVVPA
jgi:CheY-like chemotaxis protein